MQSKEMDSVDERGGAYSPQTLDGMDSRKTPKRDSDGKTKPSTIGEKQTSKPKVSSILEQGKLIRYTTTETKKIHEGAAKKKYESDLMSAGRRSQRL